MFVGGRRRSSNNVRAMQLFHELKQQFPTIPDHVVSACISNNNIGEPNEERRSSSDRVLREMLEAAAATLQQELMGQNVKMEKNFDEEQQPNNKNERLNVNKKLNNLKILRNLSNNSTVVHNEQYEHNEPKMNASSDLNRNKVKRPDSLEIRPEFRDSPCRLKPSDKCKDVHKLLNAEKPPKSPQTPKRPNRKETPSDKTEKPQTVETPTQTTDTLQEQPNLNHPQPNLNLQLSVNCSITSPNKHSTSLNLTPQLPWCQEINSPRSYTSVNLTLRPPSSEPQAPIDITSKNSSLTYSTSSFDSQKGLQSRLQITVGPTGGSVSSVRTRPRSYHPEDDVESAKPTRPTGSLQDLTLCTSPTLLVQQSALDRMRIALNGEKQKLIAIQSEVQLLEIKQNDTASYRTDAELEKQLQKEIRHLRGQCERLAIEVDRQTETRAPLGETSEEFYRNIYTGQRGPLIRPTDRFQNTASGPSTSTLSETDGPKWSCKMCTFQNHPLLDKCEQCEMSRILHGNKIGSRANQSDDFDRIQKLLGPILKSTSQPVVNNVEGGNFLRSFSTPHRNREVVDQDSATSTT